LIHVKDIPIRDLSAAANSKNRAKG